MSDLPAQTDPILTEQLVAYLDGELDAEQCRRIEQRLAEDDGLRRRLQSLERAWEWLDELGASQTSESFTRSTLEMVTSAVAKEAAWAEAEAPRRRRWRWTVVASATAAAGLVGFFSVALLQPDPNRELIRDLPVLENLDAYREVGDIEFLRMLHREGLFAQEESDES